MKKGILQRISKNWEETKMAPPLEVKREPMADYLPPLLPIDFSSIQESPIIPKSSKFIRNHRNSMISVRKDYSYKYNESTLLAAVKHDTSKSSIISPATTAGIKNFNKKEPNLRIFKSKANDSNNKSEKRLISILERHNYDKSKLLGSKRIKLEDDLPSLQPESSTSAILDTNLYSQQPQISKQEECSEENNDKQMKTQKETTDCDNVEVIVAQKVESHLVKQEPSLHSLKSPTEINNKINIIFRLNDNTKSLRKNIILHRRAPKKMLQKITIKETNNNTKIQAVDATFVPEKLLCSVETQTDNVKQIDVNLTTTNPLNVEQTEHLFFDDDILISLQHNTIAFFEYNRLGSLLKKGETEFKLIDRIPRRLHDTLIDSENKFQRLCYNDKNSLPIYVEMRAKKKELDNPEMCPIAFLYCNVYYIDEQSSRAKFSSVHLDTVKSVVNDIIYTTVPDSSYFIMGWNQRSLDMKSLVTGIVKYKLTPNLDLAKLASIRQFPLLNYKTKQMSCGRDSQLVTCGESQVSVFNYENGDLLMSLDLMKSYGINLTTFKFKENYLFMVYLADDETNSSATARKRVIVIGVNKFDGNTFKVIQSSAINVHKHEKIVSKTITSTNHLIVTFSNGTVYMMHLNNFNDVHIHRSPLNESIFASNDQLLIVRDRNVGIRNFAEFFLN